MPADIQRKPGCWRDFFWLTDNAMEWALLCAVSVAMQLLSIFLRRGVYTVFGAVGVTSCLGCRAFDIFDGVLGFSFVLTVIGVTVMYLSYMYITGTGQIQRYCLNVDYTHRAAG